MKKNNLTKEQITEKAKKFSSRTEWANSCNSYSIAKRRGWLKDIADKLFPKRSSPLSKWTKELVIKDASRYLSKQEWIKKSGSGALKAALKNGWLEEATTHMKKNKVWTKDEILSDAKKYTSIKEWKTSSPSAYATALKRGIKELACEHMRKPKSKIVWTKNEVLSESIKYSTKKDWRLGSGASYSAAHRNGWIEEASSHMMADLRLNRKWTKKELIEIASKFEDKKEWAKKCPNSLQAAYKSGLMSELEQFLRNYSKPFIWTEDAIKKEALKYSSRSEWKEKSPSSYAAAIKKNALHSNTLHMGSSKTQEISKETIANDAKGYSAYSDWKAGSPGCYNLAPKRGWLEEVTAHMKKKGGTSNPEKQILELVRKFYPKAHTARFSTKNDKRFSPASKFELDIYVPELRKGIEFNGDYWHSFEGLKRGRPNWEDEDLKKYHDIKMAFFKDKDIEILQIWEKDWKTDKISCLKSVRIFVGVP
jgi:hypothetical protein